MYINFFKRQVKHLTKIYTVPVLSAGKVLRKCHRRIEDELHDGALRACTQISLQLAAYGSQNISYISFHFRLVHILTQCTIFPMHRVHFQHHTMQSKKMKELFAKFRFSFHAFLASSKELV
jgi:hypothetical protein